jgi:flagellar basal-body rod protein FlgC
MSINSLRISGSALTAERARLDVISQNIANVQTTRGADGSCYRRRQVVFETVTQDDPGSGAAVGGVHVTAVADSTEPMPRVYNPGHPDANAQGYVEMPNVNLVEEMVDMITASRAYEANVAVVNATKTLVARALDIGRP